MWWVSTTKIHWLQTRSWNTQQWERAQIRNITARSRKKTMQLFRGSTCDRTNLSIATLITKKVLRENQGEKTLQRSQHKSTLTKGLCNGSTNREMRMAKVLECFSSFTHRAWWCPSYKLKCLLGYCSVCVLFQLLLAINLLKSWYLIMQDKIGPSLKVKVGSPSFSCLWYMGAVVICINKSSSKRQEFNTKKFEYSKLCGVLWW